MIMRKRQTYFFEILDPKDLSPAWQPQPFYRHFTDNSERKVRTYRLGHIIMKFDYAINPN